VAVLFAVDDTDDDTVDDTFTPPELGEGS